MVENSPEMKEILRQLMRPGKVINIQPKVLKLEKKILHVKQTVLQAKQEKIVIQH